MDIEELLFEYRDYIIGAGLIVGFFKFIWSGFPVNLPWIEGLTNWFFAAIVALAGFTYYKMFWDRGLKIKPQLRSVSHRNVSAPRSTTNIFEKFNKP